MQLIEVTAQNVEKTGFFCKMSAKGKPGYVRKLNWLKARFAEGLQMRLLGDKQRGFVEFIPGAFAWRAIENAERYMVIHCLWVVGKSKGQGFGKGLLDVVEQAAADQGFAGVAVLASAGNWAAKPEFFVRFGYEAVAKDAPFVLLVKRFESGAPVPRICGDWNSKAAAFGDGLTVMRSDQCPYLDDAALIAAKFAADRGIAFHEVDLASAEDVRRRSPAPYGTYALIHNGRVASYSYQLEKDLARLIG